MTAEHTVTVAVVGICGATHLRRCLAALDAQDGAPAFDILVVYDPHLDDIAALAPAPLTSAARSSLAWTGPTRPGALSAHGRE